MNSVVEADFLLVTEIYSSKLTRMWINIDAV